MSNRKNEIVWSDDQTLGDKACLWNRTEITWLWLVIVNTRLLGNIDDNEWQQLSESFIFRDQIGHVWTLNSREAEWFCIAKNGWQPGFPEGDLARAVTLPEATDVMCFPNQSVEFAIKLDDSATEVVDTRNGPSSACANCGHKLEPGTQFCILCGEPRSRVAGQHAHVARCWNCDQILSRDANFCGTCGAKTE